MLYNNRSSVLLKLRRYFRTERRIAFLLAIILALTALPACVPAESAQKVYYSKTSLGIKAWGCGILDVPVLVITNDPAREQMTEEDILGEIRFYPFEPGSGVYSTGDGEPAGEKAKIQSVSEDRSQYTVRLREPGKYLLSGAEFYLLDIKEPALSALRKELDEALDKNQDKTEKKTAQKLHDWLCGRVKSVIPDEQEALRSTCSEPMNALLTGYADRSAYARLFNLLLEASGIQSILVQGTVGEEEADWNLSKLDGSWLWTDPAMDDEKDKKQNKYLQKDDQTFAKDHTLCAADEALLAERIRGGAPVDAMMEEGALPFSLTTPEKNSDDIFEVIWYDGPSIVVGDSATVTWHLAGNSLSTFGAATAADGYFMNLGYQPWCDEYHVYYGEDVTVYFPKSLFTNPPEIPDKAEVMTMESASDDCTSFTVTFHKPGRYTLFNENPFYLISPEQTELAELAAEIAVQVEKAKSPTETQTAQKLMQWMNGRISYNYAAYTFDETMTPTDIGASFDGLAALLYGKTICGGYAQTYEILMKQAGIRSFVLSGEARPGGGHTWNMNRLDGVWSYTDPTWADARGLRYFAQPPEKMNRDHTPYQNDIKNLLFFSDLYGFQRAQLKVAIKEPRYYLPKELKYLPEALEGYGLPEEIPDFPQVKELTENEEEGIVLTTEKSVRNVRIVQLKNGQEQALKEYVSPKAGDRFVTNKATLTEPVRIEILDAESLEKLKKPATQVILDYENGVEVNAAYRYLVPIRKGEISGWTAQSYRFITYDSAMNPRMAGWHLVSEDNLTIILNVFFDANGKAESYEAEFREGPRSIVKSWSAVVDGTLTALFGKPVKDPESISLSEWDQIFFE